MRHIAVTGCAVAIALVAASPVLAAKPLALRTQSQVESQPIAPLPHPSTNPETWIQDGPPAVTEPGLVDMGDECTWDGCDPCGGCGALLAAGGGGGGGGALFGGGAGARRRGGAGGAFRPAPWPNGAGAALLYWNHPHLQAAAAPPGGLAVGTGDLHPGWQPGYEVYFAQQFNDPVGVDVRGFWINDFTARAVADFVLDRDEAAFSSSLQGAEGSLTYLANDWLLFSAGFRWIRLNETYSEGFIIAGDPLPSFGLSSNATNNLYGFQFGANALLLDTEFFSLNLLGKMGVYGNDADLRSQEFFLAVADPVVETSASGTAFSSEARLAASFWLTANLSLQLSYQVLFLDGVLRGETEALGGDLASNDSMLFHGGQIGLTFLLP